MSRLLGTWLLAGRGDRNPECGHPRPPSSMYMVWKALAVPLTRGCARTSIMMVLHFSRIFSGAPSSSWGSFCHWGHPPHVWGLKFVGRITRDSRHFAVSFPNFYHIPQNDLWKWPPTTTFSMMVSCVLVWTQLGYTVLLSWIRRPRFQSFRHGVGFSVCHVSAT